MALKSRTDRPPKRWSNRYVPAAGCAAQGARQIYFKICSTFDSTAAGNIGPVIEALMDELDCELQHRDSGLS